MSGQPRRRADDGSGADRGGDLDPAGAPRPAAYRHRLDSSYARNEFIRAVRRVKPAVLEDLRHSLGPGFAEVVHSPRYTRRKLFRDGGWLLFPTEHDHAARLLRPELDAWVERHKFRGWGVPTDGGNRLVNWLEPIVLSSLWAWSRNRLVSPLDWDVPDKVSVGSRVREEVPFEVVVDGWRTLAETLEEFRERAGQHFDRRLREYVERVHANQPAAHVRLRRPLVARHFDWLVRAQLEGTRYSAISRMLQGTGFDADRRAVGQGVRGAAEAVVGPDYKEWLRPTDKGGRPGPSKGCQ